MFVERDKNGIITGLLRNPKTESIALDSMELWDFLGLDYPQRGRMYVTRDATGKITTATIDPADEHLPDDHPDVLAFFLAAEKRHKRKELEAEANAEIDDAISPLEAKRLALLPDNDQEKITARIEVVKTQEKLASKYDDVAAAETIGEVMQIKW